MPHIQVLFAIASALVTLAVIGWQFATQETSRPSVPEHLAVAAAQQDLLTGLPDCDALFSKLAEEWKRERRVKEPTALLFVSVDAFAALEQENGPMGSDVALLTVARALDRMLPRKADLLARYDRATFAVVLPGTDLPGALRVAARLRWSVVRLGIAHRALESGFVSASIGVAVQHGVPVEGSTALITAACSALHTAQATGVDRLEYTVLGEDAVAAAPAEATEPLRLPSLRAWTARPETTLHTLQS